MCESYASVCNLEWDRRVVRVESSKLSKWRKVVKDYKRVGVKIAPLVLETTGRMGPEFEDLLSTIEGASVGPSRARLISQISVTLAKWNVECVREAGRKACEANGY